MNYSDYQQEAYDDGYRDGYDGNDSGEHAYPLEQRDAYSHGYQVGVDDGRWDPHQRHHV